MLWDTHMHCWFSGDSNTDPEAMIKAAIEKQLAGICFTDHMDYDYPGETSFEFNPDLYMSGLTALKEKFHTQITILTGVELGLQPHLTKNHEKLLNNYSFDFVIGSSHLVHGKDPYYPEFFKGREQDSAYLEYFESILENISTFSDFDVYGHLDYVVRYGPTTNTEYSYQKFADIIDEILRRLIQKGKGIEINMGGFKYGLGHPNPTEDILRHYHDLGGEIITIGSDAHKPEHVAYDFEKVKGLLKDAGFSYYNVFMGRKATYHVI